MSKNYATQMEAAKKGLITPEMMQVAKDESIAPEELRDLLAQGRVIIPANIHHKRLKPVGIGRPLRTKINVNLGVSKDISNEREEWKKVKLAEELGAHSIMDLSSHGKTATFRTALIERSPLMIGTVPIYDSVIHHERPRGLNCSGLLRCHKIPR